MRLSFTPPPLCHHKRIIRLVKRNKKVGFDMLEDEDCPPWSDEDDEGSQNNDSDVGEDGFEMLEDNNPMECDYSTCTVITKQSLLAAQKEDLQKVMDVLAIPEQHSRTLLIHHRWDLMKIFESLERKGRERLFSEVGVTVKEYNGPSFSSPIITCNICFDAVSREAITTMDCGDFFCDECWTNYFIVQIKEGKSRRIRCMVPMCNAICDEAIVRSLVREKCPDIADRFDRFLLESYIEDNSSVKWCPSIPHCGNAIRIDGDAYCEAECVCGLQFCFNCSSEAHSPCSCKMWELWTEKYQNESANIDWISINTKPCPKCHRNVQKSGGCNLVTCICGQPFCWLCGSATGPVHTFSDIQGHSCGRYKEDQAEPAAAKIARAKRDLYRYMHYHARYVAHTKSLAQENELSKTFQEKIKISLGKTESSIKDYAWVMLGLIRLSKARKVLAYSYPFAFYIFGEELFHGEMSRNQREMKQNLFEDQQQQLESQVEMLSQCLDIDFHNHPDDQVIQTMRKVNNLANIVDALCRGMYKSIEDDLLYPLRSTVHIAPYKSRCLSVKELTRG